MCTFVAFGQCAHGSRSALRRGRCMRLKRRRHPSLVAPGTTIAACNIRGSSTEAPAERLFRFPTIDRLDEQAAATRSSYPRAEGVDYDPKATDRILALCEGYPYFLQEYDDRQARRFRSAHEYATRRP